MARKKRPLPKKNRPTTLLILAIIAGAGVFFMITGFSVGAALEQHDGFCGICHTQPESTYVQRTSQQPVDLASFHTTKSTNCIDCHSGVGISGRVSAEMNGAHNALQFVTRNYLQPSKLYAPLNDESCLKCHEDVVNQSPNQNNHFHEFLSRWQANDPNAGGCASCHSAHTTGSSADNGFMVDTRVQQTCDACHQVLAQSLTNPKN